MTISYNWLSNYLPYTINPKELSKILTDIGLEVESLEKKEAVRGGLKGLVVGQVETCNHHENADKLSVTTVRVNEDTVLPIVCGAPNVAVGQKVIVALVGTELYSDDGSSFTIKKAKIRGEVSEGMICAEDEIGLGKSHDGIMVLPKDTTIGIAAADYFQLPAPDYIYEIGLTPNRSDANSHLGVAKDVCAYLSYHKKERVEVRKPVTKDLAQLSSAAKKLSISVNIENQESCERYAGVVISGVKIQESPKWLQERLLSVGIHPINNVVDITNFVLQEYGHPLHAFDYEKITQHSIKVKKLSKGTVFKALDGKEVKLSDEDLMICDGTSTPMCMGGVYGGLDSGVSENTTSIFIESAYFNPRSIRRSSVRHNFRTDAATHFEKGAAMKNVLPALMRAANLTVEIAHGKITSDIIDVYPAPKEDRIIDFSFAYLEKICGKSFESDNVKLLLEALGFPSSKTGTGLKVAVPFENPDIFQSADLAEEVLRIDGLDNIPIPEKLSYSLNHNIDNSFRELKERMASYLAHAGFQEIITNSITNSKFYPEYQNTVKLLNSLSSELDILRPEMLESGLEVIAYNQNRKMNDVHIFEFGKTYADGGNQQYSQTEWLCIWSSGNLKNKNWAQNEEHSDFYALKGLVTSLFALAGLNKIQEKTEDGNYVWARGKQLIGKLRPVAAKGKKRFDIRQEVFYAEIHLSNLFEAVKNNKIEHQNPPKFPIVKRDLSLILPKNIAYEQLETIAHQQKLAALKGFELFDIFEHEKIGKDNKSMALSFTFQLPDKTLTDSEVDSMMQQLIKAYEQKLNATLRS